MSTDTSLIRDEVKTALKAARGHNHPISIKGVVVAELYGPDGALKSRVATCNIVTAVGDQLYASRGAGLTSSALPTGMKLGTGSVTSGNAPAKTGTGAALTGYLSGSNKAFDATYPQASGGVVTYRRTYAPGEATSASPITEAVIVTDTITTDATSAAANTISRVALAGIGSKAAGDTLTITWTHTLLGAA